MVTVDPIGIVRSPLRQAGAPPFQSTFSEVEGEVEVFPEYRDGLLDIEDFSHLILLSHLDRAERGALTEQPLTDGEARHGVFACRHFNRPNPIGISFVALDRVGDGILYVSGLDLLDGTPILDIKPYIPAFDSIPGASTGWVSAEHIERIHRAGAGSIGRTG